MTGNLHGLLSAITPRRQALDPGSGPAGRGRSSATPAAILALKDHFGT
jgi:hypothetical protein